MIGKIYFLIPKSPKTGEEIDMIKFCPECNTITYLSNPKCPECGHVYSIPKEKETDFAMTVEVTPDKFGHLFDIKPEDMNLEQLIQRAELGNKQTGKKYRKGWIVHQIKQRENSEKLLYEYARRMGYKPGWVKHQLN